MDVSNAAGECGEVAMSNMGAAACSLLHLIAASKDELSKLRELRLEMQLLLHNAKEESQRRDSGCENEESQRRDCGCENEESEESIGSCLTNLEEAPSCSNATSSRSNTFPYLITREENAITPEKECPEKMRLLEAELEAELELLQLQLDAGSSSQSMKVQRMIFIVLSHVCLTWKRPKKCLLIEHNELFNCRLMTIMLQ